MALEQHPHHNNTCIIRSTVIAIAASFVVAARTHVVAAQIKPVAAAQSPCITHLYDGLILHCPNNRLSSGLLKRFTFSFGDREVSSIMNHHKIPFYPHVVVIHVRWLMLT